MLRGRGGDTKFCLRMTMWTVCRVSGISSHTLHCRRKPPLVSTQLHSDGRSPPISSHMPLAVGALAALLASSAVAKARMRQEGVRGDMLMCGVCKLGRWGVQQENVGRFTCGANTGHYSS